MPENVIKARIVDGPLRAVTVKREVHDATIEARQIVDEARAAAAGILAQAKNEREGILDAAQQEGHAAGLAQWNAVLVEAVRSREEYIARHEHELVRLSVEVAEKIISRELKTDPDTVLGIVRAALKCVRREKNLVIQVNPNDESVVRAQVESLRAMLGGARELVVAYNLSIAPGGCVIESEIGIIDAQISTQLKALEQALLRRTK